MTLPGLACLLVLLAALERLGLWATGQSWLPWRRNRRATPASAAGLDEMTALFYGTKHLELEQRRTELMLRDDADDAAPRRLRLDLGPGGEPTLIVDGGRPPGRSELTD